MNLELLSEEIRNRLIETGYQKLTDIQLKVIPLVLEKKDVVTQSRTGTGKTAAFLIPILDADFWKQKKYSQPQVLILEPIRELASQVKDEAQKIAPVSTNLKIIAVHGGKKNLRYETKSLREGVDIVAGTLGRVKQHLEENNFQLNNLKFLVLDEVDEMISEGFLPNTEQIIKKVPSTCQILLFSATVSPAVKKFAERFLKEPFFVTSQPEPSQVNNIQQYYLKAKTDSDSPPFKSKEKQRKYYLKEEINPNKNQALVELIKTLNQNGPTLILVFTNTKWGARTISKTIKEEIKGLAVGFSNGNLPQDKRDKILKAFKNKEISLLVTTVLGRGVHIDNVDYVINYGIPQNPEAYTHRIGRTGRAGSKGVAITLVDSDSELDELLKTARRQKIKINEYKLNSQKSEDYRE